MIQTLHSIQRKIDDIGLGLLRVRENKLQASIQIRAKCDQENLIQCYAIEKKDIAQFSNRKVSLVQKWDDDYLYISGQTEPIPGNSESLAVRIFKACWLVRKRNGSIRWFQEKHIYHLLPE